MAMALALASGWMVWEGTALGDFALGIGIGLYSLGWNGIGIGIGLQGVGVNGFDVGIGFVANGKGMALTLG